MPNLELSDWLYLGRSALLVIVILTLFKVSYSTKAFSMLPATKPRFCLLPKYVVSLPIEITDMESNLSSRLAQCGFCEVRSDANSLVFGRGSALGDFSFSIKTMKLIVTASLPLSNPVQLKIEYGAVFGCAFDTGDLWKFCRELTERLEATRNRQNTDRVETDNPYQSPPS